MPLVLPADTMPPLRRYSAASIGNATDASVPSATERATTGFSISRFRRPQSSFRRNRLFQRREQATGSTVREATLVRLQVPAVRASLRLLLRIPSDGPIHEWSLLPHHRS